MDIKQMIPKAIEREFTDIIVLNEDRKKASILFIYHASHSIMFLEACSYGGNFSESFIRYSCE